MKNTTETAVRAMPETAQKATELIIKDGNKTFIVGLHFSESSKDTLEDKVKNLTKRDVESGVF